MAWEPSTDSLPHPMQPIGWDKERTLRFKRNAIVDFLVEECRRLGGADLHQIGLMVARGQFSMEDQVQLAQLMGYSVGGFCNLIYVPARISDSAFRRASRLIRDAKQESAPTESPSSSQGEPEEE